MYVLIVYKRPYHAWLLITWLQFTTLQVSKNVGPIWGSDTTYLRWMKSQHCESFQLCPKPEGRGVGVWICFFSAIIPPSVLCVYVYIYNYIYCIRYIYKRSMEVFSGLHSGGFFLTENRTGSLPELLTNRHASFIMACCWAPVVISRVDLTGFFIKWTPKPPHTIHTEPAPFSCRFRDHGKVNQNSRFTPVFHPPGPQIPPPSWRALLALRPTHHNRNQRTTAAPSPRERGRVGFAWEKRLSCFLLKRSPFSKTCTPLQHPTTSRPKVSKNLHVKIFCTSKIHTSVASCPTEKKVPKKPTPSACCTDVTTTCGFTSNNFTWARNCSTQKMVGKKIPSTFGVCHNHLRQL